MNEPRAPRDTDSPALVAELVARSARMGRPPMSPGKALSATIPPVRCSDAQRAKFERLGGAAWLRKAIDRAR